jgi:hypothetical protein
MIHLKQALLEAVLIIPRTINANIYVPNLFLHFLDQKRALAFKGHIALMHPLQQFCSFTSENLIMKGKEFIKKSIPTNSVKVQKGSTRIRIATVF